MKKLLCLSLFILATSLFTLKAQFVLNGDATVTSPECSDSTTTYQLTPDLNTQAGEIWYTTQVSLTNRFDIQFEIYLGTKAYTVGADGICFVFQQQSVNAGSNGGGMGYGGITPSLAVEFDTYKNSWDPAFCHTAIEKNGDVNHTDLSGNNLAGPVQLSPTDPNLPDGNWHQIEIIWNPVYDSLSVYFDCSFRVGYKGNVVSSIFGGNPNVYWGFTGGTGGSDNTQEVCVGYSYLSNLRDTAVCAGNSVQLTGKGGVSYTWSPASSLNVDTGATVIATPTVTTTYTVNVKNSCGLISKDSATIVVNPKPTATMGAPTNILCSGQSTGSASVSVSSGTAPYTYSWAPAGGSNATATGLSAGTYTVYITDSKDCSPDLLSETVVITQPAPFRDSAVASNSVSCHGGSGSATIGVAGGTAPYTYLWNTGGNTTASETGLSIGTYTVTITDSRGCPIAPVIITITQPNVLDISIASKTVVNCEQFGYIVAHSATGGTPPYTYLWTPSGGTSITTTTLLTAGTYTITVTDSNGCTGTAAESISYPSHLDVATNSIMGTTCFGGNNGSATVTASGGTPAYTYSWFPGGGTHATEANLSAGLYTLTVTDSNGCIATDSILITQPAGMEIITDSTDVLSGEGCNGEAGVTVSSGGTPPYTYSWSPGGETTANITGQCAGVYCCTVTQANGCSQNICVVIGISTGFENVELGSGQITVYPNPNNGIFTIQSQVGDEASSFEIYNVLGQKLLTGKLNDTENNTVINLRDKSAGVYFYRVINRDGGLLGDGKIVIEK